VRDGLGFRLQTRYKWDLCSSGVLRSVIGSYRRFGTTYRSLIQPEPWNGTENVGVTIKAPTDRFPETSLTTTVRFVTLSTRILEYGARRLYRKKSTLRNIPEERRSPVVGCCEHGHEPSCSMKWGELTDQMRNYELIFSRTDSWR